MPAHRKELNIKGSNLWYLVGLIASDGNLSKDGRHVDITSKEQDFLIAIRNRLGLSSSVCLKNKGTDKLAYRIQISNINFYEFLLSIGLTPNKSLSISRLDVPEHFFNDFLRGLIDGDGSIRKWDHPGNNNEQWSLRIYSGSNKFLGWLDKRVQKDIKACGRIHQHHSLYVLKFGKIAARQIFKACYYKNCFGLQRKVKLAQQCCNSLVGWSKSTTVLN